MSNVRKIYFLIFFAMCMLHPPESRSESSFTDRCKALSVDITARISAAAACSSDSDCKIVSFGCPFGCQSFINSARLPEVQKLVDSYSAAGCDPCKYKCKHNDTKPRVGCRNSKCIDVANNG